MSDMTPTPLRASEEEETGVTGRLAVIRELHAAGHYDRCYSTAAERDIRDLLREVSDAESRGRRQGLNEAKGLLVAEWPEERWCGCAACRAVKAALVAMTEAE